MRVKTLLVAILAVVLAFGACKKVKELADVTFDANFVKDLEAIVPPGSFRAGTDGTFAVSETIDPLSNSDVEKYVDNIKSWNIVSITAEIIEVSRPDVNLLSAQLSVYSDNHSASWQVPLTPLVVGQKITLGNENGEWDTVNSILDEKRVFTVAAQGETDEDDITFTIQVTIKTKVTANPL